MKLWIKKHWWVLCITIAVLIAVPFIINAAYLIGSDKPNTAFSASDLLSFYGSILSVAATVLLSIIALRLNNRVPLKINIKNPSLRGAKEAENNDGSTMFMETNYADCTKFIFNMEFGAYNPTSDNKIFHEPRIAFYVKNTIIAEFTMQDDDTYHLRAGSGSCETLTMKNIPPKTRTDYRITCYGSKAELTNEFDSLFFTYLDERDRKQKVLIAAFDHNKGLIMEDAQNG